ncbi:MAG: TatD-related deoxyribonuclease [Candidatus Hecatellales archaeon B24]|nr:MAG: TatD-related deoxyribonuclease [Candidatus Hecatellales archaeon B24]
MKKVKIKPQKREVDKISLKRGKPEPTYIDSHIHLSDEAYQGKIEAVLEQAEREGVRIVIANSEDLETSLKTLRIAESHPLKVLPAIGVHPWAAPEIEAEELGEVVELIARCKGKLAAVGEVGLDTAYTRGNLEAWKRQREVFHSMLEAAEKAGLPVIAHSRRSSLEVFEESASYRVKMVFHWFSGEIKVLKRILDAGCYITVGPSICYSRHIQRVAGETPLSRVMTETDGPVKYKGPFQNLETTPALIPKVVEKIAEVKRSSLEEVAAQIVGNCRRLFARVNEALE